MSDWINIRPFTRIGYDWHIRAFRVDSVTSPENNYKGNDKWGFGFHFDKQCWDSLWDTKHEAFDAYNQLCMLVGITVRLPE